MRGIVSTTHTKLFEIAMRFYYFSLSRKYGPTAYDSTFC